VSDADGAEGDAGTGTGTGPDDGGDGDGDRILDLVGIAFAAFFVIAVAVFLLAAGFAVGGGDGVEPPQANWTAERINDTHIRITHVGGEPVQANDLIAVVGKTERAIRYDRTLVNGASITVAAPTTERVVLYWNPGETVRRKQLASWAPIRGGG
jgi:hypothetical protein